jgi:hypothetical protein
MKLISNIVKVLSLVTGLSAYTGLIPEKYLPIAALAFGVASTLKDLIVKVGDYADDKQINGSFKP